MKKSGFTLIELLIVIAIILILIAIALPNFLAAQVRARITRIQGDMRALATANEAYFTEYNTYALGYAHDLFGEAPYLYLTRTTAIALSTPVAYIKEAQVPDIFAAPSINNSALTFYIQSAGGDYGNEAAKRRSILMDHKYPPHLHYPNTVYAFVSAGPDGSDDTHMGTYPWSHCMNGLNQGCVYVPTNGTKSRGDLVQTSGRMPAGWVLGLCSNEAQRRSDPWF